VKPVVRAALLATVLAGCYRPSGVGPCVLSCDPLAADPGCPGALACTVDGLCATSADDTCDSEPADGNTDTGDGPKTPFCYGLGMIQPCFDQEPSGTRLLTTETFNTDDCAGGEKQDFAIAGSTVTTCVIAGASVGVANGEIATIVGTAPLVMVGVGSVVIGPNAKLDAGSTANRIGAGGDAPACPEPSLAVSDQGGAGGSFGTQGGRGGQNVGSQPAIAPVFHGGCVGGRGGGSTQPGHGGGAVYLISPKSIAVLGHVLACGGGGAGAQPTTRGGGGGGSGGFIGISAASLSLPAGATILALGGGGGGGSGGMANENGSTGQACNTNTLTAGGGFGGSASAGDGGNGGSLQAGFDGDTATPSVPPAGSGGGGGGAGVIELIMNDATVAGAIIPNPL
jgi:hypothetical protein